MATETVTEDTTETVVKTEPQTQPISKTLDELQAENARIQAALKEANKEAAARRKKLDEFEKAEEARKLAELSETDRLKQELTQAQMKLEAATRTELQRSVADELGLPVALATRLVGSDREAMLTDGRAMLEALPKTGAPKTTPTNPSGASKGETDEQRKLRLGLR
jgi:multidrug efflux pump subunit AcrA (membrane-fusion protein)